MESYTNDFVIVNFGGDILRLPITEFDTPKKRFWFESNHRRSGDNPKLEARARIAWTMYNAKAYPWRVPDKIIPVRLRGPFRFWLRCSLTKLGVI